MLKKWADLPEFMRVPEVRPYYEALSKKKGQKFLKRLSDVIVALILLIILLVPMLIIGLVVKVDSQGPVFYRQERVTKYGKRFRIHKFRTMVNDADKHGPTVTVSNDNRVTRVGKSLRDLRLDELPQLFDVLSGDMSFVGTRPEAVKYVEQYKAEYLATLLLPAGITSEASIRFKDEGKLLKAADDVDGVYINDILSKKMGYNLNSIKTFSFVADLITMVRTVFAVFGKNYY